MAIVTDLGNSRPMNFGGFACGTSSALVVIPKEPVEIDFCACDFACDYIELALYTTGAGKTEKPGSVCAILTISAKNHLVTLRNSPSFSTCCG